MRTGRTKKIATSSRAFKAAARGPHDPRGFAALVGAGRSYVTYRPREIIFRQGDPADAVYYLQKGKIQITVVSRQGKEGVIAILESGEFFGEGCLAGQPRRLASAAAIEPATVLKIKKETMIRLLHEQPAFSEKFMAFLLSHTVRIEADLVDQLFNSSERRLARVLVLLTQLGREGKMEKIVPKISQDVLAAKVGTTRSRVNFFMNKFRKLGFIDYNGGLKVHSSLLNVVVHD
jgi:CRP/FNR family transcriptional regulator, cyclic AMP receptor protein